METEVDLSEIESSHQWDEDSRLTLEEVEDLTEAEDDLPHFHYSGQDFDIAGLVRRQQVGDIVIPQFDAENADELELDGFQRKFVWTRPQMDRFIESLLMGLPVPNVFFVRQSDNRYLVLDGQQRLTTLRFFYEGRFQGRTFALKNVAPRFRGVTYRSLDAEARRALDNQFLQAIVVATDGSTQSRKTVYRVFERLNSGGTQLTAHEIRIALYAGPAIRTLAHLNAYDGWRAVYGKEPAHARDQELLLRAIAMLTRVDTYQRPLKTFLNETCDQLERWLSDEKWHAELERRFHVAVDALSRLADPRSALTVGRSRVVNAAKGEAVLAALMNHGHPDRFTPAQLEAWLRELDGDVDFRKAVSQSTAEAPSVQYRVSRAGELLARAQQ